MIKRDIYAKLLDWKGSKTRKPLILRGARQVGKTYILKEFAKNEYNNFVYLNFEDDDTLDSVFMGRLDINRLVKYLSAYSDTDVKPGTTLIILDEIQVSDNALNSLKYFNENANEYHIVAAGSLLGLKFGKKRKKSFPVGKVNLLYLYPLTYLEFIEAMGKPKLRAIIEESKEFIPYPEPIHFEFIELLKQYYYVGGMPEAVSVFIKELSFNMVRKVQDEIIETYLLDFSKHAEGFEITRINLIWQSIPAQLGRENKKFKFSIVKKSARSRDYENAMQWLVDAGLVYKSFNISSPKQPLSSYSKANIFKIFLLDIGLLGALSDLGSDSIIRGSQIFTEFHGALVENYVAQQLVGLFKNKLFYWTSPGKSEVDFLFQKNNKIYPLEAKAGINLKSQSLKVFSQKYQAPVLSRTSLKNFKKDTSFCNYPLYAISLFPLEEKITRNQ